MRLRGSWPSVAARVVPVTVDAPGCRDCQAVNAELGLPAPRVPGLVLPLEHHVEAGWEPHRHSKQAPILGTWSEG